MQKYLFALVMAAMLLLSASSNAQSISISPAENSSAETSASSVLSDDSIIQIPDKNFEAAVRAIIGKPDGNVTAGDVAGITSLNVSLLGIADLTGIEHFTALKELDCSMNRLTVLDVSKNVALESLQCGMNNITVLDVGQNVALKELYCWSSGLMSLNLNRNVALEGLDCGMNSLKILDVSQNLVLEGLSCDGNQLAALDVSQNTALKWLSCDDNQLMVLDVSRNLELKYLSCRGNQLTSLELRQNPELEDLFCEGNELIALDVSQNPRLWSFSCQRNQLTELDVSHNIALRWFFCDDNQLSALDVSRNAALVALTCSENQLMRLDVSHNVSLEYLQVQNNLFPDQSAIQRLREGVPWSFVFYPQGKYKTSPSSQLPDDTAIHLPDPNFEASVREEIGKPKGDITAADVVEITTLRVEKQGIADLTGIEYFTALKVLRCEGNLLSKLDVSKNTELTHLYCQWNQLTALNVSHEAPLEEIHCYDNQLRTLDLHIGNSLVEYCPLYCYNNLFPDESAIVLDPDRVAPVVFHPQLEE
jgi:Leucine-rich repeat (LRR) protein